MNDPDWPASSSPELCRLILAARENADLVRADLFTIRDWLQISGYQEDSLIALMLIHILGASEGSLCTELSKANLTRRFRDLVSQGDPDFWAERILADLQRDSFPRLFGATADDDRPLILYPIKNHRYLYFQKFLRHEQELTRALRSRLENGSPATVAANFDGILDEVLRRYPMRLAEKPLVLDRDQLDALQRALVANLVLISGGPGTGKTSIVLTLLRCLVRSGVAADRLALAAPTGRAAQRLGEAIRLGLETLPRVNGSIDRSLAGVVPSTLHHLLDYHPGYDNFRRHAENQLDAEVVIVDEVSMVGVNLMAHLLEALRPEARLILLGDKDQLPSVDAGAVLAHLVPPTPADDQGPAAGGSRQSAVVMLRTNHRSEPRLRAVAEAINQERIELVEETERLPALTDATFASAWRAAAAAGGCRLLEQTQQTAAEIRRILRYWAEEIYLVEPFPSLLRKCRLQVGEQQAREVQASLKELFRLLDKSRLLTLIREGPWGCVECNRFLEKTVRGRLDELSQADLFVGAPVLLTRNDPGLGLYNGDVGLTVRSERDELCIVFQRQGGFVALAPEALPPYELGFALTVHKSQGSEYDQVLVVLPPEGGRRLLTKELIYTAVTRARKLAVLCATPDILRLAISRKCNREAGLLLTIFQGSS